MIEASLEQKQKKVLSPGEGTETGVTEDRSLPPEEDSKLGKAQRMLVELQKQHAIAEKLLKQTEVAVGPVALPVTPLERTKEEEELILLEFECCIEQEKAGLRQSLVYGGSNATEMARRARVQSIQQTGRSEGIPQDDLRGEDKTGVGEGTEETTPKEKEEKEGRGAGGWRRSEEEDMSVEAKERLSAAGGKAVETLLRNKGIQQQQGGERRAKQIPEQEERIKTGDSSGVEGFSQGPMKGLGASNGGGASEGKGEGREDAARSEETGSQKGDKFKKSERQILKYSSVREEEKEDVDDIEEGRRPKSASACVDEEPQKDSGYNEASKGEPKKQRSSSTPSSVTGETLSKTRRGDNGREAEKKIEKKKKTKKEREEESGEEEIREQQGRRRTTALEMYRSTGGGEPRGATIETNNRRVSSATKRQGDDGRRTGTIGEAGRDCEEADDPQNEGALLSRIEQYQDEVRRSGGRGPRWE